MSFYWQQGLPPQQDTGQQAPQQGQWDFINLGGAPAPQHQWNPAAQQQQTNNYYYPQQYHNQSVHQQQQYHQAAVQQDQQQHQWGQQQQSQLVQHTPAPEHQPSQVPKAQPTVIEHTPILRSAQPAPQPQQVYQAPPPAQNYTPAPTSVPNYTQPQQYYHQQTEYNSPAPQEAPAPQQFAPPPVVQLGSLPPSKEVTPEPAPPVTAPAPSVVAPKKEEPFVTVAVAVQPVVVEEQKTKVTPTSSEDDWEKADMEVQRVEDKNKQQPAGTLPPTEKPEESRESSSLGESWSQQDTEPSERSSAEPVEIVDHPVVKIEEVEEKTPRVSLSEATPTPNALEEHRQETPDEVASRPGTQNGSSTLNNSSPGVAVATSTPKDFKVEKRPSISSQGKIEPEKQKKIAEVFAKPQNVEKEESGNNSDSTMASGRPDFERGHARASYREYKKTYMEICDRLKIMRSDSHHTDFRPSSKLANPLLAAARHPAIRRESTGGRSDGRASVPLPLPHSQSFTDHSYQGRRSRLDPNARPSSRQAAGYQSANLSYDQRYVQNPHYRQGRYSAIGMPYRQYAPDGYDPRRQPYMDNQYAGPYAQEPQETSSLSESEEEGDDNGESDDEIRRYNMYQQQVQRGHGPIQRDDGDALYYCGIVHVNMEQWRRIKEKYPLPAEFYGLKPIEKAAYMFYAVVFKQPYRDVDAFHKRFNREFYKYACAGNSEDDALFKVCRSMQQQYLERQKEKEQAYQNMKATLFSDETSLDGHSEINSVYEESLNACDIYNNGPLKFTCPHSFLNISTGGQMISIQPDQSISVVTIDNIQSNLKDIPTRQIKESAETFKGPLIPHQSAPHTVKFYIRKQIDIIENSDVAKENPKADDVVESLLVWRLLETMVAQHGNITGPDIADLIVKTASQPINIEAPPQSSNITPALNKFTHLLLGGHIDDAVTHAIDYGLFADALVLTRRLFPNDLSKIEKIERQFLLTRSQTNPVTTLVAVASGDAPPVLRNPSMDDHLSWRTHAAIILANLDQRGTAMKTIYELGKALAKKDYHCAADFCFLVYCVLGGENPFAPKLAGEEESEYRRHISLVNSDIPDNEANPKCRYGFLLTDLHATEIFDYALRLKENRFSPLETSVEYQVTRIKYAKLLANHGMSVDAYKYCTDVARAAWNYVHLYRKEDLLELADLAESLHFVASVNPAETQWIHDLRRMVQEFLPQPAPVAQQVESHHHQAAYRHGHQQEVDPEAFVISHEPLQPTPVQVQPAPEPVIAAPAQIPAPAAVPEPNHYQQEDFPPTPAESVHQEPPQQHFAVPQHPVAPPQQQQPVFDDIEGFTTPPDFDEGPLSMSAPQSEPLQQYQHHQIQDSLPPTPAPAHIPPPAAPTPTLAQTQQPQTAQQAPPAPQTQQPQEIHQSNSASNGWFRHTLNKVTGQNPMILPNDKNKTIVWDPVQNKYVGEGVEQEATAPPPPMVQQPAVPTPSAGGGLPAGGGLRAVRGAARYAKVGATSSSADAPPPPGMMPPAPTTATFGFMPAPVDNDDDPSDPFSGQANPTIQQSATLQPLPSE